LWLCSAPPPLAVFRGHLVWRANRATGARYDWNLREKSTAVGCNMSMYETRTDRVRNVCCDSERGSMLLNPTLLTMTRVNISCVLVEDTMQCVLGWLCDVSYVLSCRDAAAHTMESSIVPPSTWD